MDKVSDTEDHKQKKSRKSKTKNILTEEAREKKRISNRKYNHIYNRINKEKKRIISREYYQKNKEKFREYNQNRRKNLTEEKKKRQRQIDNISFMKRYHKNIEDMREKNRKKDRIRYYKNVERSREVQRVNYEKFKASGSEQYQKRLEYLRNYQREKKRLANLSEEERAKIREKRRSYNKLGKHDKLTQSENNTSEDKGTRIKENKEPIKLKKLTRSRRRRRLSTSEENSIDTDASTSRSSSQSRQETSESNVRRSERIMVLKTLRASCIEYEDPELIEDDELKAKPIPNESDVLHKLIESFSHKPISENIDNTESDILQHLLKIFNINFGKEFFMKYLVEIIKHWHKVNSASSHDFYYDLTHYIASSLNYIIDKQMVDFVEVTCSFEQLKCLLNKTEQKSAINPKHTINWPHISMRIDLPGLRLIRTNNNYNEFTIAKDFNCDIVPLNTALRSESKLALLLPTESVIKLLKHLQYFIVDSSLTISQKLKLIEVLMEFEARIKLCGADIEAHTEYNMHLNDYAYVRKINEDNLKSGTVYLYEYCCPQIAFSLEDFEAVYDSLNYQWLVENLADLVLCKCKLCDEELGSILSENLHEHLSNYHGFEKDWNCVKCGQTFSTDCLSTMNWKHICYDNFVQFS